VLAQPGLGRDDEALMEISSHQGFRPLHVEVLSSYGLSGGERTRPAQGRHPRGAMCASDLAS